MAIWLLATGCVAQAATVYRWVDERGRVHYGDTRGKGASSIEVTPGSGAAKPADEAGQLRSEECERRREQLETYKRATSVVETDALGRRHEYDPEQKAKLLQIGEQQVQNACGAQG
ncbi:DUF4124 domain-containing protein [Hydrocarboniphaga sp.]|uniref:DUF4124 domain-containing protein n=1 Tax=Hydrocarboniphaga sp. TaxID=2033016 RepID=UPI003D0C4A70